MYKKIVAPFSAFQTKSIIEMQYNKEFKTISCPHDNSTLFVTRDGLYCKECDYIQEWAYDPFVFKVFFKGAKKVKKDIVYYLKKKAIENIECVDCNNTIKENEKYVLKDEFRIDGSRIFEPICKDCWPARQEKLHEEKQELISKLKLNHKLPIKITNDETEETEETEAQSTEGTE